MEIRTKPEIFTQKGNKQKAHTEKKKKAFSESSRFQAVNNTSCH